MSQFRVTLGTDGVLSLNMRDVLAVMDRTTLAELIDSLAVQDAVIEQVTNQIVDGATDMDSWAGHDEDESEPRRALGIARRRIALMAPELAAKQVEAMAAKLKAAEATIERVRDLANEREISDGLGRRNRDTKLDAALSA